MGQHSVTGCLALLAIGACTLTSDPYNPPEVEVPMAEPPQLVEPAPAEPPAAPPDAPAEPVQPTPVASCASGELPGCELPRQPAEVAPAPTPECVAASDCESRNCQGGRCLPATCSDGIVNQGETATDCAGPCPERCGAGDTCVESADCAAGLFCPTPARRCTAVSCGDGVQNGNEVGEDCGGACPACPVGTPCGVAADCITGVCRQGTCSAARCDDQVLNQNETGVDCGGACNPCAPGNACNVAGDCNSLVCSARGCAPALATCCQPARCNDGVRNGNEPVADCGNQQCGACPLGNPCTQNAQCATGLCQGNRCVQQPCLDGTRDGNETDTDCGGNDPVCARCPLGDGCIVSADCAAGTCVNGTCANCTDGVRNGSETDRDCGGVCGACAPGLVCRLDSECTTSLCEDGRCCGGNAGDCTRCARRISTALDCNGASAAAAPTCTALLDCLADNTGVCVTRLAVGCTDAGGVCDTAQFGGNGSEGVVLADRIIGTAQCNF